MIGDTEYKQALEKQEKLSTETLNRKAEGLQTENQPDFCEHPHVYTLGRSARWKQYAADYDSIAGKECFVCSYQSWWRHHVSRPGRWLDIPFFDPWKLICSSQIMAYIIIEEAIFIVFSSIIFRWTFLKKATGVWLDTGKPACRKIHLVVAAPDLLLPCMVLPLM